MAGLRKEIEEREALDLVALAERLQVASERSRVAREIGQAFRRPQLDHVADSSRQSGSRRIHDDAVGVFRQCLNGGLQRVLVNLDIAQPVVASIESREASCNVLRLDRSDALIALCQVEREEPDSGVEIGRASCRERV